MYGTVYCRMVSWTSTANRDAGQDMYPWSSSSTASENNCSTDQCNEHGYMFGPGPPTSRHPGTTRDNWSTTEHDYYPTTTTANGSTSYQENEHQLVVPCTSQCKCPKYEQSNADVSQYGFTAEEFHHGSREEFGACAPAHCKYAESFDKVRSEEVTSATIDPSRQGFTLKSGKSTASHC